MKWYWWIVIGIIGINVLVMIVVGVFILVDRLRSREAATGRVKGRSAKKTAGSGR
jgi:uncharacterized membrane protein